MQYPTLHSKESTRQSVDVFGGYNHNLRIGDGEFYDMKNMTSDDYPVLAPRKKRGMYAAPEKPLGMISKDSLCYIDGSSFVMNEYRVDMGLSDTPKSLVSMGAYVIILPDKKWINTLDLTQYGDIEAGYSNADTQDDVTFTLCSIDGTEYVGATASSSEPENAENMQLWIDTSSEPHVLKQYSSTSAMWIGIASTYIKISASGIGTAFEKYDGVTISGVRDQKLKDLNSSMIIWTKDEDYIVVTGILDNAVTQEYDDTAGAENITIKRQMPAMDFVIESENRLWGCRYGIADNGEVVNEIYASKLGDFKNWNCFMGVATDSYAVSCGTDGQFTGAVTHLGFPLFFKENCVHKIYGNYPANFQVQTTHLRGVQKGCSKSLAIVNEVLYYKSQSGVCGYDGGLPVEISGALGDAQYDNAVAGAIGNKYYISMRDVTSNIYGLFVYDTKKSMWHKEDDFSADSFCQCREDMYAICAGSIVTMLGSGQTDTDRVQWMVETGPIGINTPDQKYISRLSVRMSLEFGTVVDIYVQYDFNPTWDRICSVRGIRLESFSVPVRPKRCDYIKLRIEGIGNAKIYSIVRTMENGSELI